MEFNSGFKGLTREGHETLTYSRQHLCLLMYKAASCLTGSHGKRGWHSRRERGGGCDTQLQADIRYTQYKTCNVVVLFCHPIFTPWEKIRGTVLRKKKIIRLTGPSVQSDIPWGWRYYFTASTSTFQSTNYNSRPTIQYNICNPYIQKSILFPHLSICGIY